MNRQNLFSGDLHIVQRVSLAWLMNEEINELVELERMRIRNMGLAVNPATSSEFLQSLFDEDTAEEENWIMPQTAEELDQLFGEVGLSL